MSDSVLIEKGYFENTIRSNQDLTQNGVAALEELRKARNQIDDVIKYFEPLVNRAKKFPHNDDPKKEGA